MKENLARYLKTLFRNTPFHPQWLIYRDNYKSIRKLGKHISGNVVDIGCGHCEIKKYLSSDVSYTGIDYYYTSVNWYGSSPDIYADAQKLPLKSGAVKTVFLFDVLEHLPEPELCLKEISRILVKGGKLIIQVPFVYPVHDAPLDFRRWTSYGLERILLAEEMEKIEVGYCGEAIETSLLMLNMALAKTLLNSLYKKNPLILLLPLFPIIIFCLNIFAIIFKSITPKDNFMPFAYRMIAEKK